MAIFGAFSFAMQMQAVWANAFSGIFFFCRPRVLARSTPPSGVDRDGRVESLLPQIGLDCNSGKKKQNINLPGALQLTLSMPCDSECNITQHRTDPMQGDKPPSRSLVDVHDDEVVVHGEALAQVGNAPRWLPPTRRLSGHSRVSGSAWTALQRALQPPYC
ncbi:uncharacterized protein LY79DRAFT_16712 [Colletotrichum navitas]|uniref:Uncharacterized protein n=1 Tax=Colletotrichum navitas TaxID=681940 RepID=A0AAD8VBK0_9PEZI|nr:uncharacterized protein LY79DRAFT_16712 [Colletotrichum navitas]KAK1600364.1 hypothetical protein LY79DRAFT_16712 [Colletotrichum navitas]